MGKIHAEAATLANRRDLAIATLGSEDNELSYDRPVMTVGERGQPPFPSPPNYAELLNIVTGMQGELDALRAKAANPASSGTYRHDNRACFQCKKNRPH